MYYYCYWLLQLNHPSSLLPRVQKAITCSITSLAGLGPKTITSALNNDFSFNFKMGQLFLPGVTVVQIVSLHRFTVVPVVTVAILCVSVTASVADTSDNNHDSVSRPAGKAGFHRPIDPLPSGHLFFSNKRCFVLHISFMGPTTRLPVYRRHWSSNNGGGEAFGTCCKLQFYKINHYKSLQTFLESRF